MRRPQPAQPCVVRHLPLAQTVAVIRPLPTVELTDAEPSPDPAAVDLFCVAVGEGHPTRSDRSAASAASCDAGPDHEHTTDQDDCCPPADDDARPEDDEDAWLDDGWDDGTAEWACPLVPPAQLASSAARAAATTTPIVRDLMPPALADARGPSGCRPLPPARRPMCRFLGQAGAVRAPGRHEERPGRRTLPGRLDVAAPDTAARRVTTSSTSPVGSSSRGSPTCRSRRSPAARRMSGPRRRQRQLGGLPRRPRRLAAAA